MALDFTTSAAAPTNVVNSEQNQLVLFGAQSTSHTSATFTVDQQPYFLSAFNLGNTDVITVQQVFGQGSGTEVSSFAPIYGPVTLSVHRTKCRIDHPGRYQLLHTGSSPLGTFTVVGAAGTMTHDAISDLAESLNSAITQEKVYVQANVPLIVSGTGILSDPYVFSTPTVRVDPGSPFQLSIGQGSTVRNFNFYGIAIGTNANAQDGVSIGSNSICNGLGDLALGNTAQATANSAMAIGGSAHATAAAAISIGKGSTSQGQGSIAIGNSAAALATNSIAIGHNAGSSETHTDTLIIATANSPTNATQNGQIVLGTSAQTQLVTAGSIIQGGAISASDERLKKDVIPEEAPLQKLAKLSPVTFTWDRDKVLGALIPLNEDEFNKKQHGLIAQQVETVFPEFVESVDRGAGVYKYVRYDRLITVLLAAIQELNQKVEKLEAAK